jgi:hypothetical protein
VADAMSLLLTKGAVTMDEFPYDENDCARSSTPQLDRIAASYRIASFRKVRTANGPFEVMVQLVSGYPVVIAMNVYQNFDSWRGRRDVYRAPSGGVVGQHAMVVVGYNNDLSAFKVQNSWGSDWGDRGYSYIDYDVFRNIVFEAYDAQNITPLYQDQTNRNPRRSAIVTPANLKGALRLNIDSNVLAHLDLGSYGHDWPVRPWSLWLNLPEELSFQIDRVQYWFFDPSFKNPKWSEPASSTFITKWSGYGCISHAAVSAYLKSGDIVRADFNLCDLDKD